MEPMEFPVQHSACLTKASLETQFFVGDSFLFTRDNVLDNRHAKGKVLEHGLRR